MFKENFEKQSEENYFKSPEGVQVTERTYEQYLEKMNIPEKYFEKGGIVLDIGSGFSNFVETVNNNFTDKGTRAIGLDPVYKFLEGDFENFQQMAGKAKLFPIFSYGRTAVYDENWKANVKKLYEDFSKEAKESGNYITGSHQKIPFDNESIDFVVSNNSITNFTDKSVVFKAFNEIIRVLKKDGEARICPAPLEFDEAKNGIYASSFYDKNLPQEAIYSSDEYVYENELIEQFSFDEENFDEYPDLRGVTFYAVLEKGPDSKKWVNSIIIRKDRDIPKINKGENNESIELRRLKFSQIEDDYSIHSEIID